MPEDLGIAHISKQGFRVTVSKNDSTFRLEQVKTGNLCRRVDDPTGTLIVLGEVIGTAGPLSAEQILRQYLLAGEGTFSQLDGAFVIVFLRSATGVLVVTDRLNALKCFVEETPDGFDIVSSLHLLRERGRALDPIALVSFLCNGAVFCNRTMFHNVMCLPRGAVHTVSSSGPISRCYWRPQLDSAYARRLEDDLCQELSVLIEQAIRRRTSDGAPLYLSLSGGYDSACLLGFLAEQARTQTRAFSYSSADAAQREGTDANVAVQMAGILGIEHFLLPSFTTDLMRLIRNNVYLGEGRANLCLEWDVWQRLQDEVSPDAVFLAGDEWLGDEVAEMMDSDERASPFRAFRAARINTSVALSPFAHLFTLESAAKAFDEELGELFRSCDDGSFLNVRSRLYLELRLSCFLLPWRELFVGRRHLVRQPFLDRAILEFIAQLSSRQRLRKRVFKRMARRRFPTLFAIPRAHQGDPFPWLRAVQRCHSLFERRTRTIECVDQYIPETTCSSLLDLALKERSSPRNNPPAWLVFLRALTIREFARSYVN
jgi:hypothetical protein